ncbi:MAG: hypothetical protein HZA90_12170 [Verrucomicrobia bacterium]|nr:hypothetical protein [Verrucomicrobiota bacterium]
MPSGLEFQCGKRWTQAQAAGKPEYEAMKKAMPDGRHFNLFSIRNPQSAIKTEPPHVGCYSFERSSALSKDL